MLLDREPIYSLKRSIAEIANCYIIYIMENERYYIHNSSTQ